MEHPRDKTLVFSAVTNPTGGIKTDQFGHSGTEASAEKFKPLRARLVKKNRTAKENISLQQAQDRLPREEARVRTLLARLRRIQPIGPDARVLDVGAAQGESSVAFARCGLKVLGVEPWDPARAVAQTLAEHEGVTVCFASGMAERLPFPEAHFDLVHASNVIEHVCDVVAAFKEAHRVLRTGGVFWFSAASSLCPRQREIDGFPAFGWYPDLLKRRIMAWAAAHKPHLVGHTQTPAINWFSPRKAHRMLRHAGFVQTYDRWDLRLPSEGGRLYRIGLRLVLSSIAARFMADVLAEGCAYAAVK